MTVLRKAALLFSTTICVLLVALQPVLAQKQTAISQVAENNWQSIFDGKTLNGWKASHPDIFSVEDGAITGKFARQGTEKNAQRVQWQAGNQRSQPERPTPFLLWQGSRVVDFRLRFKCRLTGGMAHAGIHFRSQIEGRTITGGYQADLPEDWLFYEGLLGPTRPFDKQAECGQSNLINQAGEKTESFFGEKQTLLNEADFNQWVDYEIFAYGPHIFIEINGRKVAELIDHSKAKLRQNGSLALSLHPLSEMQVQLKDIELKVLRPQQGYSAETQRIEKNITLGETILSELGNESPEKALQLLKENPSLVHFKGNSNGFPLLEASARGHQEVVKWLIANGAKLNEVTYNGFTPIYVTESGEVARLLIKAGADLNHLDNLDNTPLQDAAQGKNLEVVKAILESGYKMDLISAVYLEDSDLVARMIQDNPAIVNAPRLRRIENGNQGEFTALIIAVRLKNKKITELLLNAGADVNAQYRLMFSSGPPQCMTITPLSSAVLFGTTDLIGLLLHHGASVEIDCGFKGNLLQFARENSTPEIIALLEKYKTE